MFVVLVQTAAVKRGFSMQRIVKKHLTNRLKITTLDSLLRIKLLSKGEKLDSYDVERAARVHSLVPVEKKMT